MLAFLGGTGPEGRGLALRLALAGEPTIIGSRDAARAAAAAEELLQLAPGARIEGAANADAAARADVVFLTFPYEGQRPTLELLGDTLSGKVVVNVIAPMQFQRGRGASAIDVEAGSAAEEAQELLPSSLVAAAFQNASAEELQKPGLTMGRRRRYMLRPSVGHGLCEGLGAQNTQPASGGWRLAGQCQVRGANYSVVGKHQPDLQNPRWHKKSSACDGESRPWPRDAAILDDIIRARHITLACET